MVWVEITQEGRTTKMPEFSLPALPYAANALEPIIDQQTVEIHHDKHHATYVANLNAITKDYPELQAKSVDAVLADLNAVPEAIRTAVRNNGGGVANHNLYWDIMTPGGPAEPTGAIGDIVKSLGGYEDFKAKVIDAGLKRFGSGWAWLVLDAAGNPQIVSTANQDSPLSDGQKPLLALDVWEHAYYLKYQNRRADYLKAWWSVVNWEVIGSKL